eukprot:749795-Hanusia_phi.AAC.5
MCGPGYELDEKGIPQPIEPESEGSSNAKGPGYFIQPYTLSAGSGYFRAMDEEGTGVLVGDAFKTVIGRLEEEMPMEPKESPWMTPKAAKLIEEAGAEGKIDYVKFVTEELESPRDDAL